VAARSPSPPSSPQPPRVVLITSVRVETHLLLLPTGPHHALYIYGGACERAASQGLSTTGEEPACSLICRRPNQILVLVVIRDPLACIRMNAIGFLLVFVVFCTLYSAASLFHESRRSGLIRFLSLASSVSHALDTLCSTMSKGCCAHIACMCCAHIACMCSCSYCCCEEEGWGWVVGVCGGQGGVCGWVGWGGGKGGQKQ
jgi:hypothetical protein